MIWATPWLAAVVAACLIPPLILLYFLKLRRREHYIPSTLLWKQSVQDLQANALFQRLRMSWLLLLQLIVLALILLAIAQPEYVGEIQRGSRTVILIDRSASMTATDVDGGGSRLDEAKRQAIEYIDGMKSGGIIGSAADTEQVMVIGFSDEAQVYSTFTSSKAQLTAAVQSITPTHGRTALGEAIELARAYTINTDPETAGRDVGPPATLLLFSDGRISDLDDQVARANEPVVYRPVGKSEGIWNVGIAALGARRSLEDSENLEIYVRVANYSTEPRTVDVDLSVGDLLVNTRTLTIEGATLADPRKAAAESGEGASTTPLEGATEPSAEEGSRPQLLPGSNSVTFALSDPRGLTIGIRLHADDGLAIDNVAYTVIPPARQLTVALVAPPDGWIIESAMSGIPFLQRIENLSPEHFANLASTGDTEKYDLIILDGVNVEKLGPGRYLTFGIAPPLPGFSKGESKSNNTALSWKEDHPINANMNYHTLFVSPTEPLDVPREASVLVEGSDGPMVVEAFQRGVSVIAVQFRPVASNWPFDVNLVKFMQNTLDYLGRLGDALTEETLRPGQAIVARLPSNASEISILRPDGVSAPIDPLDPTMTSYTSDLAGLYVIKYKTPDSADEQTRAVAVNFFDEAEGDIAAAESVRFGRDAVETVDAESGVHKRTLWPWALLAALAFLCVEWVVYNRKAYV
ncbi:MAG: BatA and WFA domain-containing protein [Phycisphaerales bacterium]|nr:BatA and WFA domain-containing protein [Phycisphaerales bacterium]